LRPEKVSQSEEDVPGECRITLPNDSALGGGFRQNVQIRPDEDEKVDKRQILNIPKSGMCWTGCDKVKRAGCQSTLEIGPRKEGVARDPEKVQKEGIN